jgi:hypothetical protein
MALLYISILFSAAFAAEENEDVKNNAALQTQLALVLDKYIEIQDKLADGKIDSVKEKSLELADFASQTAVMAAGNDDLKAILHSLERDARGMNRKKLKLLDAWVLFEEPSYWVVEIVHDFLKQDKKKPRYKVFYCPVKKLKWVQVNMKPESPFHHRVPVYSKHHQDRREGSLGPRRH